MTRISSALQRYARELADFLDRASAVLSPAEMEALGKGRLRMAVATGQALDRVSTSSTDVLLMKHLDRLISERMWSDGFRLSTVRRELAALRWALQRGDNSSAEMWLVEIEASLHHANGE
jgi:hypothetical protein